AIVDRGRVQTAGTGAELKAGYGGEMVELELGRDELPEQDLAALRALEGVRELQRRGRALLFVTPCARELAPRVAAWCEERGAPPRAVRFGPPSLGDVFLKVAGHGLRDEPAASGGAA